MAVSVAIANSNAGVFTVVYDDVSNIHFIHKSIAWTRLEPSMRCNVKYRHLVVRRIINQITYLLCETRCSQLRFRHRSGTEYQCRLDTSVSEDTYPPHVACQELHTRKAVQCDNLPVLSDSDEHPELPELDERWVRVNWPWSDIKSVRDDQFSVLGRDLVVALWVT